MLAATIGLRASAQAASPSSSTPAAPARSGEEIFKAACITCHGPGGKGNPKSHVGFDVPLPDFSDCAATTPEVEHDWLSVVHDGGPARAFDRHMPSFAEALSDEELRNVVHYLRSFCSDRRWPLGELNLPRPLNTEKAFPENEAVMTANVTRVGGTSIETEFAYEHRLGARTQYELAAPIAFEHPDGEPWARGLGDAVMALKHVVAHGERAIFTGGGELTLPTGKETEGLGGGVTVFEPFVAYGQILPSRSFVQVHAGVDLPADRAKAAREAFWRVAAGRSFNPDPYGRMFTPMLELLAAKELVSGEHVLWDVVPQMQVTLSRRQHVRLSGGLQFPVNERDVRGRAFSMYVLWDWFDGPLFSGW